MWSIYPKILVYLSISGVVTDYYHCIGPKKKQITIIAGSNNRNRTFILILIFIVLVLKSEFRKKKKIFKYANIVTLEYICKCVFNNLATLIFRTDFTQ